ncbi:hypothetical protein [Zhihengliuella sp. ISTPL4]|uniref:hypothetical protein n=1 Tax=Zhihengliuella sp. ISTPL4 TaxID=2058657 RepID=UPI000C7CCB5E|nr:hypothetical protein [Zhihengliuella sp. ISTPL4]
MAMTRRTPPDLAEREARARAVTAERVAADRAAARAAHVTDVRERLALAEARRYARPVIGADVYTRPPTTPTLDARATGERTVPGLIAAAELLAAEAHADALAAIPENHTAYDWSQP